MQRYGDFQGFATILLTFERVCCDKWGKMRQIEQIRSKFVRSRVRASKRSGDRFAMMRGWELAFFLFIQMKTMLEMQFLQKMLEIGQILCIFGAKLHNTN
jgi:hypothetical protein